MTFLDAKEETLDGKNHYRMSLPPDIPAERFWSIMVGLVPILRRYSPKVSFFDKSWRRARSSPNKEERWLTQ